MPPPRVGFRRGPRARPVRVPRELLSWARRPRVTSPAVDPFAAALHPPAATPRDERAIMAMDEDSRESAGWAQAAFMAQNSVLSAYAEGTTFLGFAYLAVLSQRAEYRVPSEIIATECTREWIEFSSHSEDEGQADRIKQLEDELDRLGVKRTIGAAIYGDGLFGRGHIYVDTKKARDARDETELKTSIGDGRNSVSREKIKKGDVRAFRYVEAQWAYPTDYNSSDPLQEDWYRPRTWYVMGKSVHRTRLLTLVGREVPDLLKPAYSFGGLSLSQMIKPYVDNWLGTRQSVADLIRAFTVWIFHTDLSARLALGGQDLMERVDLFNSLRDNHGAAVVDKDSEEVTNVSAPLGSLDSIQAQSQEHMSGVTRIPLVKLFGISPHGLNASSEGEIRAFYDWIKAYQEHLVRPPLTTIIDLTQLSLWGEIDEDITYSFKPLWQLDEAGKSAIQKTRADTHDAYLAMGVVGSEEVREAVTADKDSPYAGLSLDPAALPEPPEDPGLEGGDPEAGEVKDPPNRLASGITNQAATVGGASGMGFTGT